MLVGSLVCVIFVILAVLLMTRKFPAFMLLPVLAVAIAALSGMPLLKGEENIFTTVLVNGATKMSSNMLIVIFACWMAGIMSKTGVSATLIKKTAELGGDRPAVVVLLLCAVSVLLFSVVGGVGAVAMIGSIVLPMMLSLGISPLAAANMFLGALSAGYAIRPANLQLFSSLTDVEPSAVMTAAWVTMIAEIIFILVYLFIYMKKKGAKYAFAAPVSQDDDLASLEKENSVTGIRGVLACMTPVLLIALVYFFNVPIIPCYVIGILWLIAMTAKGSFSQYVNMLTQAAYKGMEESAAAIWLFISLGMVLTCVNSNTVQTALLPFMEVITPNTVIALAIFCAVLAPLSLYRGPMNVQGLGACLAVCMLSVGNFSGALLGAIFMCTSRWPTQACPTATQVVWISNNVGEDPVRVSNKVFIANWIMTAATIAICALLYTM